MLLGFDRWKLLLLFLTDSCDLCSMHCTFLLLGLRYGLLHGQVSCSFSLNPDFGVCLCNSKDFFGAEISCWMWTGERQSTKMRIRYLEAALSQDIQFFDTEVRTSDVVFAINTDAVMVQDAISEKVKQKPRNLVTSVSQLGD